MGKSCEHHPAGVHFVGMTASAAFKSTTVDNFCPPLVRFILGLSALWRVHLKVH